MTCSVTNRPTIALLQEFEMRRFVLFFLFLFIVTFSFPQVSQPQRYEHEHKSSDHEFIVISMGERGLALVKNLEKFEHSKRVWKIIFLDSTLTESWTTTIEIDQHLSLLGHDFRDGNIYLIFQEREEGILDLAEIHPGNRWIKYHKFKPQVAMRFTHFIIVNDKAIFGGYISKEPALILYDLTTEGAKVIPGMFQSNVELLDVLANTNNTFNVIITERTSDSNKNLVLRTFDTNGVLLVNEAISIQEGKSIISAIPSALVHDELVIMGTWSYGSNKAAAGIFSVAVDPFREQKINYYDFSELNHFLEYLKPKKVARIKAKADWRKSVGKPLEYRTHLLPVRIEETKDGFSFLTEVYDPGNVSSPRSGSPYNSSPYNNSYSPYGYSPYGYSTIPRSYYSPGAYPYGANNYYSYTDTRMIHSSLFFFDIHGKLVTDHALKFEEIKLNTKEQVSDFITYKGLTTMACKNEKEITISVSQPDGTVVKEEKIKPALKNDMEEVRSESLEHSRLRTWYGRYFYVYGYHTVRNNSERTSRDVFYINKIKVE